MKDWPLAFRIAYAEMLNRYARSTIGPFWLTLQTAVFVGIVGYLVSRVFAQQFGFFFAWFSTSYVFWLFFSGVLIDSTNNYRSITAYILNRGVPVGEFFYLPFYRQCLHLLHTIAIPLFILLLMHPIPLINVVYSIPGFALFFLTTALIAPSLSVLAVRYRDVNPIIESVTHILFLTSPVIWPANVVQERAALAFWLNPISHLMAIWREPLFHGRFPLESYLYMLVIVVILALLLRFTTRNAHKVTIWF